MAYLLQDAFCRLCAQKYYHKQDFMHCDDVESLCQMCMMISESMHQDRVHREEFLWKHNLHVVGVDEVGRGALAGPVVAAALSFNMPLFQKLDASRRDMIRDSKTLSAIQRLSICHQIKEISTYAVVSVHPKQVDRIGIAAASRLAMVKAASQVMLCSDCDILWVDGRSALDMSQIQQYPLIQGDRHILTVSAASIIAKVYRDQLMQRLSRMFVHYSEYGFEQHVGYGTAFHLQALRKHGVSSVHRLSFAPMKYQKM